MAAPVQRTYPEVTNVAPAPGSNGTYRPDVGVRQAPTALDIEQGMRPGRTVGPNNGRHRGWGLRDIDWRHCFRAQHYGTMLFAILSLVTLAIVHYLATPRYLPFFTYDASISYIPHKDSVTAAAAVLVPLASLLLNLAIYEFIIYRKRNLEISNALATTIHFFLDGVYCFIFALTITEISKFTVGSLRPGFLYDCQPNPPLNGQIVYGPSDVSRCTQSVVDTRKGFPSGHASTSSVLCTYIIIYLLWSGYVRGGDAAFLGLDKKTGVVTGFRGRHRIWRELGHGVYLMWILLHFIFIWGVGLSRVNDNKHTLMQVFGGWFLGVFIACISATRACALHKYIFIHNISETAF